MQVSIKYGFAFLSTPKCASTSIESILSNYSDGGLWGHPAIKHINARSYKKNIEPLYRNKVTKEVELVCVMREPLDWLHSWYRYRSREELKNPLHHNHKNYTGDMSFNDFVSSYLSNDRPDFAMVGSQSNFMQDGSGELLVDKIFRFENISTAEKYFSGKIGKGIKFPRNNVSPSREYNLSKDLHEKLIDFFKKDYFYYNEVSS